MKSKKPIIGIGGSLVLDASGRFKEYYKACVNDDYVTSILQAGGIPIILPVVNDEKTIYEQLLHVDGIVFSGGLDVDPKEYGEEVLAKCGERDSRRDWFDIRLFKMAKKLKKPTLCICKGHQIAAVAHGGTLYQDLSYYKEETFLHDQYSEPDFKAHEVKINKDSLLFEIVKKQSIKVNSFHHQMIKDLPKEFKVTALSPDGIIEAMEYIKSDYFFLSLQWHPEMMAAKGDEQMQKVFKRLIKESNKNSKELR